MGKQGGERINISQINLDGQKVELPLQKRWEPPFLIDEIEAEPTKEYRYYIAFEILKPNLTNPYKASISLSYRHIQSDTIKSIWVKIKEHFDLRKMVKDIIIQYYLINRKQIIGYSDIRNSIHKIEREAEEEAREIMDGGLI